MPGIVQQYEVLLNVKNDTHDPATVQLQKDYGRNTGSTVLLYPGESLTLVLDAGSPYRYSLKTRAKVANVTWVALTPSAVCACPDRFAVHPPLHPSAKSWRDVHLDMSRIFPSGSTAWPPLASLAGAALINGITVDKCWKDGRFCMWYDA